MKKIYGDEVRKRAGFEEGIMEAVKPPPQLLNGVEQIRLSGTKFMENTTKPIEQLVDRARPKMREVVHDLSESALNITRRSVPLPSTIDVSKYSVVVVANTAAAFEVSQPITVKFTAPASHPKLDWIGVYPIDGLSAAAAAVPISAVPSQGRWHYLGTETAGEIVFSGSFLPVIPGKYEFRLHYSDNHGILARSASFALTRKDKHTLLFFFNYFFLFFIYLIIFYCLYSWVKLSSRQPRRPPHDPAAPGAAAVALQHGL